MRICHYFFKKEVPFNAFAITYKFFNLKQNFIRYYPCGKVNDLIVHCVGLSLTYLRTRRMLWK